jgi:hypothetical protein
VAHCHGSASTRPRCVIGLASGSLLWLRMKICLPLCSARTVAVLLEQSFRCEIIISVFGRLVEASRQMRSRMAL